VQADTDQQADLPILMDDGIRFYWQVKLDDNAVKLDDVDVLLHSLDELLCGSNNFQQPLHLCTTTEQLPWPCFHR